MVDQGTGHGDLYTQIRGEGAAGKRYGREYRWLCVCLQNMQGLGLNN